MTNFNPELQKLQAQMARQKKLQTMLNHLYTQRPELEKQVQTLDAIRISEQADVDRLEGGSLAALFYRVIGKRDEKLDKERKEAYAAAVKFDALTRELHAVKHEIDSYERELDALSGCEAQYAQLLEKKMAAVKESGSIHAAEMLQLQARIGDLESQQKEIGEAHAAGQAARNQANQIASSLDSANGWGTWDVMGGGLLADMAKYSHLDKAQAQVETLQVLLSKFDTELSDVIHSNPHIEVQVSSFMRFADFFFDNLFTDWAVLSQIHDWQNQIANTIRQIEQVLNQLQTLQKETETKLEHVHEELDALVVRA